MGNFKEFIDIPGFEKYYKANGIGQILSVAKTVYLPEGKTRQVKAKILKPIPSRAGYHCVELYKNGSKAKYYIHRLVALTFIGNPPEAKSVVNHKNRNKTDNRMENLEWVTHAENITHGYSFGDHKVGKGQYNHKARIILNKESGIFHFTVREAAESYGMKPNMLGRQLYGMRRNKTSLILV